MQAPITEETYSPNSNKGVYKSQLYANDAQSTQTGDNSTISRKKDKNLPPPVIPLY